MTEDDEYMKSVRARLAAAKERKHRLGSTAAKVAVLLPEVQAARAAGKTWEEIGHDLRDSAGQAPDPNTVRIAFRRASEPMGTAKRQTKKRTRTTSRPKPEPVNPLSEPTASMDDCADMFGPMFDARDTQGRPTGGE
ncbi:hypothetical protein [Croceibacterium ferulae]|uniref:hypothetical protein n=1 Tax=Croceibacterium ferulae TaxID=1854641 RepID=UPI000F8654F8|nr:hypothetical protein [Croceibacterium ferulae]